MGLCDEVLGEEGRRQHRFDWLLGDPNDAGRRVRLPGLPVVSSAKTTISQVSLVGGVAASSMGSPAENGARPARPDPLDQPGDRAAYLWQESMNALQETITAARTDPVAARQLLTMFTAFSHAARRTSSRHAVI